MISPVQIQPDSDPAAVERCRAKARYRSKRAARTHLNRLLRGHRARGLPPDLRCYCCPICSGWHLTKIVDTPKVANLRDDRIRRIRHRHEVRERLEFIAARKAVEVPKRDNLLLRWALANVWQSSPAC